MGERILLLKLSRHIQTMSLAEVEEGDYLYLEEEGSIVIFKSWEREGLARIVREGGGEGVYPVKGAGYTFYVIPPDYVEAVKTNILQLKNAKKHLEDWISENATPL
jgi:hypothetical protein